MCQAVELVADLVDALGDTNGVVEHCVGSVDVVRALCHKSVPFPVHAIEYMWMVTFLGLQEYS